MPRPVLMHASHHYPSWRIWDVGRKTFMNIAEAQKEIRSHFAGGFYGQLVSSAIWAISASLAALVSSSAAIAALVFGGFLIFPITELLARFNRAPALSRTNELKWLGMQIAFVLPVSMVLLIPVVRYNVHLFYPAMMVLLGAHYIPFVFLYGMRVYAGLAAFLAGGGVFFALTRGGQFSIGAWYTAAVLSLFALLAKAIAMKERT
jgi:hypothetical protein